MKDQNIELPEFPTMLRKMWSGGEVQQWIDENIAPLFEADRQRRGDNNTGRNDATQDALNKVAEVFCMDPDELDDPYTVVSAAKDFFANWELDRKNWDRKRRGEPVAWYTEDHLTDKSATTYDPVVADRWKAKGWPVHCLCAAPQPAEPVKDGNNFPIDALIRRRGDEWVLELSGSINGTTFVVRHTEPLTTNAEDVAGLPSLYAEPVKVPSDAEILEVWYMSPSHISMKHEVVEFARALLARYGQPTPPADVPPPKEPL